MSRRWSPDRALDDFGLARVDGHALVARASPARVGDLEVLSVYSRREENVGDGVARRLLGRRRAAARGRIRHKAGDQVERQELLAERLAPASPRMAGAHRGMVEFSWAVGCFG